MDFIVMTMYDYEIDYEVGQLGYADSVRDITKLVEIYFHHD